MKTGVLLLFLALAILPLVSANGLQISPDTMQVNKTAGADVFVNITIRNEQPYKFFNISFSDTLLADKFDLNSGQNKTVQFKITSDSNLDKQITIFGFYESNLGASNRTEIVQINYPTGLDKCGLNMIQGDKIVWQNNVLGEVTLKNTDTNLDIATILSGNNYTLNLDSPMNFNYYVTRIGTPFTPSCNINVMGTSGLIHNADYDDKLTLDLNIKYEETTLSAFFLTTNYNLSYNDHYSDIFSLRNNGSKIAKNIKLESDWMTFDKNNFDLEVGQSINVGYTISPSVYETNQTNKAYTKTIKISGNFPTIEKGISVFVKYANLGTNANGTDYNEDVIAYIIKAYCEAHPTFESCKKTIVYANGTGGNTSIIIGNDAWQKSLNEENMFRDEVRSYVKNDNERQINQTILLTNVSNGFQENTKTVGELKDSVDTSVAISVFYGLLIGAGIVITALVFIIMKKRGKIKVQTKGGYSKGEDAY